MGSIRQALCPVTPAITKACSPLSWAYRRSLFRATAKGRGSPGKPISAEKVIVFGGLCDMSCMSTEEQNIAESLSALRYAGAEFQAPRRPSFATYSRRLQSPGVFRNGDAAAIGVEAHWFGARRAESRDDADPSSRQSPSGRLFNLTVAEGCRCRSRNPRARAHRL